MESVNWEKRLVHTMPRDDWNFIPSQSDRWGITASTKRVGDVLHYPIRRKDTAQTSFLSCNVSNKAPCSTKSSSGARANRVTSRKKEKEFSP